MKHYPDDTSIVDFLESEGLPFDMKYRKKLAAKYGVRDYKGTAEQNTKLLDILRSNFLKQASAEVHAQGFWAWLGHLLRGQ